MDHVGAVEASTVRSSLAGRAARDGAKAPVGDPAALKWARRVSMNANASPFERNRTGWLFLGGRAAL